MPLTSKGNKILGSMQKTYGDKKGQSVFYASINAGKVKGAEKTGILRRRKKQTGASGVMSGSDGGIGGR